jgi:hypothetical protein
LKSLKVTKIAILCQYDFCQSVKDTKTAIEPVEIPKRIGSQPGVEDVLVGRRNTPVIGEEFYQHTLLVKANLFR